MKISQNHGFSMMECLIAWLLLCGSLFVLLDFVIDTRSAIHRAWIAFSHE